MNHTYLIYRNFLSLQTSHINSKWLYMWIYHTSDIHPVWFLFLRIYPHTLYIYRRMYMCAFVYVYIHIYVPYTHIQHNIFIKMPCTLSLEFNHFPPFQESVSIHCGDLGSTYGNDGGPAFQCCLHVGFDFTPFQPLRPLCCLGNLGVQPHCSQLFHFVLGCEGLARHHKTVACFYFLADS